MRGRIAVLPLLALGLFAPAAPAQGGGNEVPRELVQALLFPFAIRGRAEPAIFVGRLPAGIPAALVPADARPVGGVGSAEGGQGVVVVPRPPVEAIAAYRAQLERGGWHPCDNPSMQVPADIPALALCGPGSAFLAASATARAEGGSELRVFSGKLESLVLSPRAGERQPLLEDVPFPELTLPEGANFQVSSSSATADYHDRDWWVESAVAPAEIAAHLLAGLRGAGWTAAAPHADEDAATGWATLRDARGKEWRALVTVIPISNSMRGVAVRVVGATAATPPSPHVEVDPMSRATGEPVPVELAAALLVHGYGERPTLVSGRFPRELEGAPVPAGGRVVGGVSYREQATGVVFVPGHDAPDVLAGYAETLRRAGWIAKALGGQPYFGTPATSISSEFCTPDERAVTASAIPLRDGGSYVSLDVHAGVCTRERAEASAEIPLPPLTLPQGVQQLAGGWGGGSSYGRDVAARLDTRLAPAALVDYYAALLRQAGWTVRPTAGDESGATASAELRDARGVTWHGLIASLALSPTEREVLVSVVRPQPR